MFGVYGRGRDGVCTAVDPNSGSDLKCLYADRVFTTHFTIHIYINTSVAD